MLLGHPAWSRLLQSRCDCAQEFRLRFLQPPDGLGVRSLGDKTGVEIVEPILNLRTVERRGVHLVRVGVGADLAHAECFEDRVQVRVHGCFHAAAGRVPLEERLRHGNRGGEQSPQPPVRPSPHRLRTRAPHARRAHAPHTRATRTPRARRAHAPHTCGGREGQRTDSRRVNRCSPERIAACRMHRHACATTGMSPHTASGRGREPIFSGTAGKRTKGRWRRVRVDGGHVAIEPRELPKVGAEVARSFVRPGCERFCAIAGQRRAVHLVCALRGGGALAGVAKRWWWRLRVDHIIVHVDHIIVHGGARHTGRLPRDFPEPRRPMLACAQPPKREL
eukprot:6682106-Prymnesium_polylepis.1